ncbi:MAG: hypothetical protein O3C15_10455 [Proteobacteria bacterium]|nr:hypothetical protein [Pseudomonadota bacterium]
MSAEVPSLTKISLSYSVEEDRIRMDSVSSTGDLLRLWFTARLLNRLVPHLVAKQLNFQAENRASDDTRLAHGPVDPSDSTNVICGPEHPEVLVAAIGLSVQGEQIVLTFKRGDGEKQAVFGLSLSSLAQWNEGLKRCYQQAEWPQDTFRVEQGLTFKDQGTVTIH